MKTSTIVYHLILASLSFAGSFAFNAAVGRRPLTVSSRFTSVQLPLMNRMPQTSLHVLAEDTAKDDAIIRQLNKEMEKMEKHRQKVVEELNKANAKLAKLRTNKASYLDGQSLGKVPEGGNFSETTARSAVKSMMWRVIAGSVTFITSLRFSGSIKTALSIVGSDFFSKAATMFIGERLMNKSSAGRDKGIDGVGRSLAKALIWRLFAICNTLTMAVFIAKDLSIASKIAGSDAIFKTALMFFYERSWAKVEWGKEYQVDYFI